MQPEDPGQNPVTLNEFRAALRDRKKAVGLYNERVGGVQFLSASLFRATVVLAPNVPVGTHKARAFLFRNGLFIKETSAQLAIVKSGFEQMLFRLSRNHSFFYGICAVGLAIVTGWLGPHHLPPGLSLSNSGICNSTALHREKEVFSYDRQLSHPDAHRP